ncbi:helix-turn-helix domain-containing protein [Cyclobacterium sp.]|uniref:helix-turn-helix domain-containing protein n=1 Tax=Cyclobacterium sp. TaxID=1966343 RepID=UPI0019B04FE1|nr:helix-turn-helix domain-containing protein [Cyclobacterium sp.]MBD3627209.1 helix-turn-helix transcriptional regulator [Cyclobacterium sp.]
MEVSLLLFINILFLATVNAIVLIVISYRMGTRTYLLGWSLLFYSLFFLVYFLWFHAGWILRFPHFMRTVNPLMFLTAPFFYFYIRNSLFDRNSLVLKDTVHFIPAVLHVLDLMPFYLLSHERKLELAKMFVADPKTLNLYADGFVPTYAVDSFRILLMSAYLAYSLWLMYRYQPNWINPLNREALRHPLSIATFLFVLITFGYFSYHTFWIIEALAGFQLPGLLSFFTWVTLMGIAFLSIYLHLNPEKLYGLERNQMADPPDTLPDSTDLKLDEKATPDAQSKGTIRRINDLLVQKQVFLQQDLKVGDFAAMAGVNSRDLSILIQNEFHKGFRELINHYRVAYAIDKLEEGYLDSRTLDALSRDSGFNSRVTFFNAFKKEMGVSPSEYWSHYQSGENNS